MTTLILDDRTFNQLRRAILLHEKAPLARKREARRQAEQMLVNTIKSLDISTSIRYNVDGSNNSITVKIQGPHKSRPLGRNP